MTVHLSVNINDDCEEVLTEARSRGISAASILGAMAPLMLELDQAQQISLIDKHGNVQPLPPFKDWWGPAAT